MIDSTRRSIRALFRGRILKRDPGRGWILGVCAGLAEYFGLPVTLVRVLAVAGLLLLTVITLTAYLTAALLMPRRTFRALPERRGRGLRQYP